MILTESKTYYLSIDIEDENNTGLSSKTVEFTFSNKELLHAILTCGMPIQRLTQAYFGKRKMEVLYKIFLVETALEEKGEHLKKSTQTMYLDSSEKSLISYYLGLFFTKLISKKLYGIDYLTHLNTIEDLQGNGFIESIGGKWRQDMIGYKIADGCWSVWEAEGGSNRRAKALEIGCEQAADIKMVNGKTPDPAVVCMTYYDHRYLTAIVKNAKSTEGEELEFEKTKFLKSYYNGVRELFMEYGHTMKWAQGNVEVTIEVPYYHNPERGNEQRLITIGLPEALFQKIMKENYEEILDVDCAPIDKYQDSRFVGGDGLYIK